MSIRELVALVAWDVARNTAKRNRREKARAFADGLERRVLLAAAPVFFHPQQTFGVGTDPQSAAVADFNNDGIPDLAVANFGDNTVSILLGNGDGTFKSQHTFATGANPNGIAVGDFNRDGFEDVVVANRGDGNVSVLLGDGTGALGTQTTFTVGTTPRSVAVGDFNGDSIPDLAIANFGSSNVSVLLGVGDGTFQTQTLTSTFTEPISVAVGDFNADGKLDFVFATFNVAAFAVMDGNGNGTFGTGNVTDLASPAAGVVVGDINGDGKPNVVLANDSADAVQVGLGQNNLHFTMQPVVSTGAGSAPVQVSLADINGDGKLDVVVNVQGASVGTLLGDGTGALASVTTFTTGSSPGATVADLNGDGAPDLIAPNFDDGTVSVLLNDPAPTLVSINRTTPSTQETQATDVTFTATFSEPVSNVSAGLFSVALATGMTAGTPIVSPSTGLSATYTIEVPDLTGNGNLSLTMFRSSAVVNDVGESLVPFVGFTEKPVVGPSTRDIVIADMNRDGKPDVVVADAQFNSVAICIGQGGGILTEHVPYTTGVSSAPVAVAVGDLNGDGIPNVVAADSGSDTVSVFLGIGDGTLGAAMNLSTGTGSSPRDVLITDINGDGKPDILVADFGTNEVGAFEGHGNGTFTAQLTGAAGSEPVALAMANLKSADRQCIVVANEGDGTVGVFLPLHILGIPIGLPFRTMQAFQTGGNPTAIAVGDFNGDHKLDVLVNNSDSVAFLPGDGTGALGTAVASPAPAGLSFMAVGDMNGDGIPDVVGSNFSRNIAFMLGNGDGTYQHEQEHVGALLFGAVALADMNSDGKPDVIAAGERDQANQAFLSVGVVLNTAASTFTSDSYTILKRDANLNVTTADFIFDGNPHGATIVATGTISDDLTSLASLTYTNTADQTTSSVAPTQPGTYEVFAAFAGNESYNAIASFDTGQQLVIAPLSPLQTVPIGRLPAAAQISGQKIRPIHFNVRLNNVGATSLTEVVTVQVTLSSSPSGTRQDAVIGSISKIERTKGQRTLNLGAIFIRAIPAGLAGTFNVLFKLTDGTGAENLISAGTLNIVAPVNDLAALSTSAPARARLGRRVVTTVAVIQNGNIPFIGSVSAELFLSTTQTIDGTSIDLGASVARASLRPGRKAPLHFSQIIPASTPAGPYFLIIRLLPATTPADDNSLDDVMSSIRTIAVK